MKLYGGKDAAVKRRIRKAKQKCLEWMAVMGIGMALALALILNVPGVR